MRDPQQPHRTTLGWKVSQAVKGTALWRALSHLWVRIEQRNRITRRYPKTTALLGMVLAIVTTIVLYMAAHYLYIWALSIA